MTNGNPSPPLDYPAFRQKRITARHDIDECHQRFSERLEARAEALSEYHKAKAKAYARLRIQDRHSQGDAKEMRDGEDDVAFAETEFLKADALAKSSAEELENLRGHRASLHKDADWAMKLNIEGSQSWSRAA